MSIFYVLSFLYRTESDEFCFGLVFNHHYVTYFIQIIWFILSAYLPSTTERLFCFLYIRFLFVLSYFCEFMLTVSSEMEKSYLKPINCHL